MTSASASVLWNIIGRLTNTNLTIRISGETGVGKEAVARLLYRHYPYKDASFLKIDCRQLKIAPAPSPMAELNSLLKAPHRSVLYLENMDHAPPEIQNRLLEFIRDDHSPCPPWILVSSLRPLEHMVHEAQLSIPLFMALDTIHIALPTLRSKSEKIPQILTWILYNNNRKEPPPSGWHTMPSMAEMEFMMNYHWPRNWRQLQDVAHKALDKKDWSAPLRDLKPIDGEAQTIDSIAAIYILSMARLAIQKDKVMEGMVAATNLDDLGLLDLAIFNEAVNEMVQHIDLVNQDDEGSE